eukprot:6180312-Pleurochrysis_carterae.AAC.2
MMKTVDEVPQGNEGQPYRVLHARGGVAESICGRRATHPFGTRVRHAGATRVSAGRRAREAAVWEGLQPEKLGQWKSVPASMWKSPSKNLGRCCSLKQRRGIQQRRVRAHKVGKGRGAEDVHVRVLVCVWARTRVVQIR